MDEWPAVSCGERKKLQARGLTGIFMGEFSGERKRVRCNEGLGTRWW
jgi:hypothetical protein